MSGEATTQIPAAATPEWIEWPESVCRAFFLLVCLLRIFVYLRFPGGNSRLSARPVRARRGERQSKLVCESVRLLHVGQLKCFERKRTAEREFIHGSFVNFVRNLVDCLSGFTFVIQQDLGTFSNSGCRISTVSIVLNCFPVVFLSAISRCFLLLWVVLVASSHRDEHPPPAPALFVLEELDVQPGASRRARFHFPNCSGWSRRQRNPGWLKSQEPELGFYKAELQNRAACGIYKCQCCQRHP